MIDQDAVVRWIRTVVPVAVGAGVAWLAARGVVVDEQTSAGAVAAIGGLATTVFYTVVAVLESKVSARFGWLLGRPKA